MYDCSTCPTTVRGFRACPKGNGEYSGAQRKQPCELLSVEGQPHIVSAMRAANWETLTLHDVDLWHMQAIEAVRSARAHSIRDRNNG